MIDLIDDLHRLIETITGYQGAAVVTAAHRVGLFPELSPTVPATSADLAARLGVSEPVLVRLLAALEALGLTAHTPDGHVCSPFAAEAFGEGSELGLVVEKEALFAALWLDLAGTVRTGRPGLAPWRERLRTDAAQARSFLEALDVLARRTGPDLAGLPALAPGRHVVDVGGGLGSYTRMLARAGSTVTLVDLPEVVGWARPLVDDLVIAHTVELVAADVLDHGSCGVVPASHDAALVSHLVHDLERPAALTVLAAACRAVAPGGHVVVNDFAADASAGAFGPFFDLMMAVETGGRAYALADLTSMMEEVGLTQVTRHPFDAPLTVLSGTVAR